MAFEFTDQNFQSAALQSSGVSVVDFWAEWCGPCRLVSPIIDELSKEYGENVTIGKLNVDTTTKASLKQKIDSLL